MAGYYAVYNDECLMHHGVKGMKWGIRRHQSYAVTGPRENGKTGKELGEAKAQRASVKGGSTPSNKIPFKATKRAALARAGEYFGFSANAIPPAFIAGYALKKSSAKANAKAGVSKSDTRNMTEFGSRVANKIKQGKTTAERERSRRKKTSAIMGGILGAAAGVRIAADMPRWSSCMSGKAKVASIIGAGVGGAALGASGGYLGGHIGSKINQFQSKIATNSAYESYNKKKKS